MAAAPIGGGRFLLWYSGFLDEAEIAVEMWVSEHLRRPRFLSGPRRRNRKAIPLTRENHPRSPPARVPTQVGPPIQGLVSSVRDGGRNDEGDDRRPPEVPPARVRPPSFSHPSVS